MVNQFFFSWQKSRRITIYILHALGILFVLSPPVVQAKFPTLGEITLADVREVFPSADELGPQESVVAAEAVYSRKKLLGYIALSHELVAIPGYSGKPISVLLGIDLNARLIKARIMYHEEPILVAGIKEDQLQSFVQQYDGKSVVSKVRIGARHREGYEGIDGISGATITAMIINKSVMASAKIVADKLGLLKTSATADRAETGATALPADIPVWEYNWRDKIVHLVVMGIALLLLLNILYFQDWLVRRPVLFNNIRIGFLLFTVFYIGFWHLAQLSILNILTFVRMVTDQFTWHTLLIDPLIFQLWTFIALVSLLWGGGVFCGWLCPFGAMQELIYKVSDKLNFPKFEAPVMVHERLSSIKYFILIGLVGLSLESLTVAARWVEIEPFKTTFIFRFQRAPEYSLYAGGLLVISAFYSKFFCKYLCPLGAALGFLSRFRVFDWLRRRKECGRPCQTCAAHCQMNAIKPTGEIISTECQYCLECQVFYWDEHRCPPLVEKKSRRRKWNIKPDTEKNPDTALQPNELSQFDEKPIIQQTINTGEKK